MHTRRRSLAVALALAAPWAVVGCGSTAHDAGSASVTTAVTAASSPSVPPSASGAAPSAAASSAPASASAKPKKPAPATGSPAGGGGGGGETENCVNPWLTVTASTSDGAAGTMVQRFVVKNVSAAACSMDGRPTFVPYGPPAAPELPLTVGAIPAGFGDLGQEGGTIVLAPGQSAAFFVKWSNVPVGDAPCPKAAGFVFRAPVDPLADADKKVPFAFQPCGGTVQVSEILPATVLS
ncbi:DUF4232 domain-containing protein [Kitasatospora sp. NBC_01539]|uniref:DUF4232 domain-containing protein n=1 Tax=Kitasatospora sp. NBC_01539 TaxID=2903577 RepID=UPI003860226B